MKYLIFGGGGFIGAHLAKHITAQNVGPKNIYNFDILVKENDSSNFFHVDVRQSINISIPDPQESIIFNLAAVHTTPGHPDKDYFETNILGAENICAFARKNHINSIVFTSSIAPYGPSEEIKEESTIPMPNSPYGISKLTAEYIHKLWQAEDPSNRKLIIVRPGVVFGHQEGGNFTRLYDSLKKGFFFYPGRKDTVKAAVYVKDVARILYETAIAEKPGVLTLNLSYFPAPNIEEICLTMARVTGVKPPKIMVPPLPLKLAAAAVYSFAKVLGKTINGIHPDRVKKLMISTNILGKKLYNSPYSLKYNLEEAIDDWFKECNRKGLK